MDPLSMAGSISGLIAITATIARDLHGFISATKDAPHALKRVLAEVNLMKVLFEQLQIIITDSIQKQSDRNSLILVEQLVVVITGCQLMVDDLCSELKPFTDRPNGDLLRITVIWNHVRWAIKEKAINNIINDIGKHKQSLTLILVMLQSHSKKEAESSALQLDNQIETHYQSDPNLTAIMQRCDTCRLISPPEKTDNKITTVISTGTRSSNDWDSEALGKSFEDALWNTPAYIHSSKQVSSEVFSLNYTNSSIFSRISGRSGISLSDVSNISIICMPITASDITNYRSYNTKIHTESGLGISTPTSASMVATTSSQNEITAAEEEIVRYVCPHKAPLVTIVQTITNGIKSVTTKRPIFSYNSWDNHSELFNSAINPAQPSKNNITPQQLAKSAIQKWCSRPSINLWGPELGDTMFRIRINSTGKRKICEGSIPVELAAVCRDILARRDLGIPKRASTAYKNVQEIKIELVPYISDASLLIVYVLVNLDLRPIIPDSQYHQWRKVLQADVFHIPTTLLEVIVLYHKLPVRNRHIFAYLLSFLRFMMDSDTLSTIVLDFLPFFFLSTSDITVDNADDNDGSLLLGFQFLILHIPSILGNETDPIKALPTESEVDIDEKDLCWPDALFDVKPDCSELWYPSSTDDYYYHVKTSIQDSGRQEEPLPVIVHWKMPRSGLQIGPYLITKNRTV